MIQIQPDPAGSPVENAHVVHACHASQARLRLTLACHLQQHMPELTCSPHLCSVPIQLVEFNMFGDWFTVERSTNNQYAYYNTDDGRHWVFPFQVGISAVAWHLSCFLAALSKQLAGSLHLGEVLPADTVEPA